MPIRIAWRVAHATRRADANPERGATVALSLRLRVRSIGRFAWPDQPQVPNVGWCRLRTLSAGGFPVKPKAGYQSGMQQTGSSDRTTPSARAERCHAPSYGAGALETGRRAVASRGTAQGTAHAETRRTARPRHSAATRGLGGWHHVWCRRVCRGIGMPTANVTIWRIRGSAEYSELRPRRPRHGGQRRSAGGLGMDSPGCPLPARPVRWRYSL